MVEDVEGPLPLLAPDENDPAVELFGKGRPESRCMVVRTAVPAGMPGLAAPGRAEGAVI